MGPERLNSGKLEEMATPIVMVHGAFCAGWVFEGFEARFRKAGYDTHRPDLLGHGPADPAAAVANLSMADYVRDIARYCDRFEEPPILIGHSLGGLVAQLVAARRPVRALVLLAPTAPWGVVVASLDEAIAAFGMQLTAPFWGGAISPDPATILSYGLDRAPKSVRAATLARLRPESGRALAQALAWWSDPFMTTSLGPGPLKAPVLVFGGEHDRIHAPASVRRTAERIGGEFRLAAGVGHWLLAEPAAEGLARTILDWLAAELEAPASEGALAV